MVTALLIDADYRSALRLKKLDWSGMNISLFTEYNDVCGIEKIERLRPQILILGTLLYGSAEEMQETARRVCSEVQLIVLNVDQNMRGKLPANALLVTPEQLNTALIQKILKKLEDSAFLAASEAQPSTDENKTANCLASLLESVPPQRGLYLVRIILYPGQKLPQDGILERQFTQTFEELWHGFLWDGPNTLCLVLTEQSKISVLYSIQVMGELLESLHHWFQEAGIEVYPFLASKRTNRSDAYKENRILQALEPYLYFCPQRTVLTDAQFHLQRKTVDLIAVNRCLSVILASCLEGNATNAMVAIDELYDVQMRSAMDFATLHQIREQLTSIQELTSVVTQDAVPIPTTEQWYSIDEEWQGMRVRISNYCRNSEGTQGIHEKVLQSLQYIAKHYREDVTMESTAERVRLSASYFSRQFKQDMGISFTEYLNRIRVFHAKTLLGGKSESVEDVAHAVGYTDAKYFSRVFKRWVGCAPSAYLAQMRKLEN